MAFENKENEFKKTLANDIKKAEKFKSKHDHTTLTNKDEDVQSKKKNHVHAGRPIAGKERRQAKSYTILPKVADAINDYANAHGISSSRLVEKTMKDKLNL